MKPLEPISNRKAMQELIDYILGKDWYVVDPLSNDQINAIVVEEIKHKLTNRKIKNRWNNIIEKKLNYNYNMSTTAILLMIILPIAGFAIAFYFDSINLED